MQKKERFGTYEIQYGTILDHDIFEHLRVSFEVRDDKDLADMFLNGVKIGFIQVVREGKKVKGYRGYRIGGYNQLIPMGGVEKKLGRDAAMIVSDYIR